MKRSNIIILVTLVVIIGITFGAYLYVKDRQTPLTYEIVERPESFVEARVIKERGYKIIEKDSEYYLVVCYGEKNTYYSYAEVSNVKVIGSSITVTIKLPDRDINASVGEAFSYPKAILKLNKKPSYVHVIYK